ncbi:MAG: hypothetical protein IKX68_03650 [Clostridiales bacterium]|nr:hypothetical protein [Clostridiales bacterium]
MNKMKRQVALGLFISSFFFRFGFCLFFFVLGILLQGVSIWFLRFGVAALLFDLIASLIDTIWCLRATKNNNTGDWRVDDILSALNNPETTDEDLSDLMGKITGMGRFRVDRPSNPFIPVAEQMKEKLKEGMAIRQLTEAFREIVESPDVAELFTDEEIFFNALVGRRDADGKKYFLLNFNLGKGRDSLSVNMFFKHKLSDPNTHLTIYCDEGRDAFYQEIYAHERYRKFENEVPLFIDVICGK